MDSKRLNPVHCAVVRHFAAVARILCPAARPAAVAAANARQPPLHRRLAPGAVPAVADAGALAAGQTVHVRTDLFDAAIDTTGGDLRGS